MQQKIHINRINCTHVQLFSSYYTGQAVLAGTAK